MLDADVIVCGGGPAGLAAAIACRMRGLNVLVADCSSPPIEKACGEGLLPEAVIALGRLGFRIDSIPHAPLRGISFLDGGPGPVEGRFHNGPGYGVKRTELHRALCRRAEQIGVQLLWRTYVTEFKQTPHAVQVTTRSGMLRAPWCIGADGLQSQIRRWSGLDCGKPDSTRIGLRRHYSIAPWSDMTEVYWGHSGQVYVTPIAQNELGVALICRDRGASLELALEEFPRLANRLRGASCTGAVRGAVTCNRHLRRVTRNRVALLGDASGSVDAVTGAGLSLAFQQAFAVADAICIDNLTQYECAHRAIRRSASLHSSLLLAIDRFPSLRRIAFASFRRRAGLFDTMLSLHSGATPFSYWGSNGALTLGIQALLG